MWTIHIRWKFIYQAFVCSWKRHAWDQYLVIHPAWNKPGWFCRRCGLERPATRSGTERTPEGSYMWYENIDENGCLLGSRRITASNHPDFPLG